MVGSGGGVASPGAVLPGSGGFPTDPQTLLTHTFYVTNILFSFEECVHKSNLQEKSEDFNAVSFLEVAYNLRLASPRVTGKGTHPSPFLLAMVTKTCWSAHISPQEILPLLYIVTRHSLLSNSFHYSYTDGVVSVCQVVKSGAFTLQLMILVLSSYCIVVTGTQGRAYKNIF